MKRKYLIIILAMMFIYIIIISSINQNLDSLSNEIERLNKEIDKISEQSEQIDTRFFIKEEQEKSGINGKDGINGARLIGEYRITVYTPYSDGGIWGYKTASGITSKHLTTCAVDKSVIPLGSVIRVNGLELVAIDTGSAVKGKVIDIFYDGSEKQALSWLDSFGDCAIVEVVG